MFFLLPFILAVHLEASGIGDDGAVGCHFFGQLVPWQPRTSLGQAAEIGGAAIAIPKEALKNSDF